MKGVVFNKIDKKHTFQKAKNERAGVNYGTPYAILKKATILNVKEHASILHNLLKCMKL